MLSTNTQGCRVHFAVAGLCTPLVSAVSRSPAPSCKQRVMPQINKLIAQSPVGSKGAEDQTQVLYALDHGQAASQVSQAHSSISAWSTTSTEACRVTSRATPPSPPPTISTLFAASCTTKSGWGIAVESVRSRRCLSWRRLQACSSVRHHSYAGTCD